MVQDDFPKAVDFVERHFVVENIDWSKQQIYFFVEECEYTYRAVLFLGTSLKILLRSSFFIPARSLNFLDDAISRANFGIQSEFIFDKDNCELCFFFETNIKNNLSDNLIDNAIEKAIDILGECYTEFVSIANNESIARPFRQIENLVEEYGFIEDSL